VESRTIIIGAGIAGLVAARSLQAGGRDVLVLDKGRGVGGRMATRRIGGAAYDHGAQFISVRDQRFDRMIREWIDAGVAGLWCHGFADGLTGDGSLLTAGADGGRNPHTPARDGHPRYRGVPGMTAIPKYLAQDLQIRTQARAVRVQRDAESWVAVLDGGEKLAAASIVLTPPVPQTLALLATGSVALEPGPRSELEAIEYAPCLVLLGRVSEPVPLPDPGVLRFPGGDVEWIADNGRKGLSETVDTLTIHCGAEFSGTYYDHEDSRVFELINERLAAIFGRTVAWEPEWQVKRWRFSRPLAPLQTGCWTAGLPEGIVIAGDAFAGARVEGAALSGLAAAETLL
jgi:predicted NAD/FAD-dependent oxidoreductase